MMMTTSTPQRTSEIGHRKVHRSKFEDSDFLRGLLDASRTPMEMPDGDKLLYTKRSSLIKHLVDIEAICLQIGHSEADCFDVQGGKLCAANRLGEQILTTLSKEVEDFDDYLEHFEVSPNTLAFMEEFRKIEPRTLIWFNPNPAESSRTVCEKLNRTVSAIREKINTPDARKQLSNFKRSSNKNLISFQRYTKKCFEVCSRLLVLRVDLFYEKGTFQGKSFGESYELARQHWQKWIRRFKHRTGKAYVGYAKILEYGIEKSFHFHVLLLLDGSLARHDILIAKRAGKDWKDVVTQGVGRAHNCNLKKDTYHRLGIGMVNADDKEKRAALDGIMAYMIKIDYFIKMVTPDGSRPFSKGDMPSAKLKSGRPRKTSAF